MASKSQENYRGQENAPRRAAERLGKTVPGLRRIPVRTGSEFPKLSAHVRREPNPSAFLTGVTDLTGDTADDDRCHGLEAACMQTP